MRFPYFVAAVPAVVLALTATAPSAAEPPGRGAGSPTVNAAATTVREVRLPTGELLQVSSAAGQPRSVLVMPSGSGRREAYTVQTVGSDLYVVPSTAQPFLGHGLDRSLFDVSALLRSGGSATRVPVRFGGSAPADVTPSSPGRGYLTGAAAAELGDALARAVGRAVAANWRTQPELPVQLAALRPAGGSPAPTTVDPDFEMWTVKVRVLGSDGTLAPVADLTLLDTDDSSRYTDSPTLFGGTTRLSLPAGNYSALADVSEFDSAGNTIAVREVSVSDVSITKNAAITLDSRTSARVSAAGPRPADTDDITLDWQRLPAAGSGGASVQHLVGPGIAVYNAPSDYAQVGTLNAAATFDLSSPASSAAVYEYSLAFPSDGAVPADQRYRATAATLATVHARYYTDVPGRVAVAARTATMANGLVGLSFAQSLTTPLTRAEYVSADPGIQWQDNVAPVFPQTPMVDVPRTYPAGSTRGVDWFRGPLVPGFGADAGASTSLLCPACRNGDELDVNLAPTVDSTPGHTEVPFLWGGVHTAAAAHLVLASGSKVLADGNNTFAENVPVPAGAATYSLTVDETRNATWIKQSTASHTVWTFPSSEPSATVLPHGWTCRHTTAACTVLPLLTVSYQLAAALDGTAPPGPDHLDLRIAHLPGAAAVPIASASVRVSFDDGATWTPTIFRGLGAGQYRAQWTNPASTAGGDVAIAISARDAAGASLIQVVHHAYTITPGNSSAGETAAVTDRPGR